MPYLGHSPDFCRSLAHREKPAERLLEQDLDKSGCLRQRQSASDDEPFINRLPVEVLGVIFTLCKFNDNQDIHPFADTFNNRRRSPMLFVQVCRFWREVCLSMPTLWSSLHVGYLSPKPTGDAVLTTWLERAKKAPLQIDSSGRPEALPNHRASILASQSNRWQVVCMKATDNLMQEFLSLDPTAMSQLQGFSLRGSYTQDVSKISDHIASKLSAIPSLRQVHLEIAGHISFSDSFIDMPFERLTHLKLDARLQIADCIAVLRRAHQAIQVTFGFIAESKRNHMQSTDGHARTSLPRLLSLTVATFGGTSSLLRHFACPALRHLYIHDDHSSPKDLLDDHCFTVFDEFLSHCRLDELIVHDEHGSWEWAKRYLILKSVQQISNVAIRVIDPCLKQRTTAGKWRCPVVSCRWPHLGWRSSASLRHVDSPSPMLSPAFWDSPYRHETTCWIPFLNRNAREDFIDE